MNRRGFLRTGSAALAASALLQSAPVTAANQSTAKAKKRIGIQLYSLRDDMAKDPEGTMRKVAEIGYSAIETYGYNNGLFFGKKPKEFAEFTNSLGMKMTSSHTNFGVYGNNSQQAWDSVKRNMEDTREAGSKWIVQAGYPGAESLDELKKLADTFNRIGELANSFGLKFAYHNHREEYRAVEDQIPYQQLIERTNKDLVSFQMDIGHVANEMADYRAYLELYPGRFGCLHIRDTNVFEKRAIEMGKGNVDLEGVFKLFAHAGVEDYYVEQEEYNYTPIESLKMCYDYLAAAKFVRW